MSPRPQTNIHRGGLCFVAALAATLNTTSALAEPNSATPTTFAQDFDTENQDAERVAPEYKMPEIKRGFSAIDRPMGMAELGLGWLTLPGAEVCVEVETGCRRGDTSPQIGLWQYFRLNVNFAWGAGVTLGLIPTTDAPRRDPPGVTRSHERGYFSIESMARYYPYVGESLEGWLGAGGGLVVLRDTYRTTTSDREYATVGTPGVTIRTEGYAVGVGAGLAVAFYPGWSLGLNLRVGNWFLPSEAARSPFDSENENASGATRASLTGRNSIFSLELTVAYRSTL